MASRVGTYGTEAVAVRELHHGGRFNDRTTPP